MGISPSKRIALNVAATYGRSLVALVCGLFTGRWLLMALGETDYGLYGLIGGLVAFVTFLNRLLALSVSRFFAYSVGEAESSADAVDALENSRRWFNVAVLVHVMIPVVLVAVGCPLGDYAVRHWLTIPPDRISDSLWVWRISCAAGFVGMVSVPCSAMYTAKQEIAELTIYGFVTTLLRVVVLYYMVSHPGVWLVKYCLWVNLLIIVPLAVIAVRAFVKYEECRIVPRYFLDLGRIRELVSYAGCRFAGALAMMINNQGMSLLVNKLLGPVRNAAMSVGNTVTEHAGMLSSAFNEAFQPALTNLAGAGKLDEMRTMALRICVISTATLLVFVLPLILEAEEVLVLWLKNPPVGTTGLCVCLLVVAVLQRLTDGCWMSISAMGKIGRFQLGEGLAYILAFFVAWGLIVRFGMDLQAVGIGLLVSNLAVTGVKLHFGRVLCGLGVLRWVRRVLAPYALVMTLVLAAGFAVRALLPQSLARVCLTVAVCEALMVPLIWYLVFDGDERLYVRVRLTGLREGLTRWRDLH